MASLTPKSGVLGRRNAAHLLRRTGFGPTKVEIDTFSDLTVDQAISNLMQVPPLPAPPVDPETGATWVINGREDGVNSGDSRLSDYVAGWWMMEAMDPNQTVLLPKMIFFLHTCFSTNFDNLDSEDNYYLLRLFRHYAYGSYKTLARKVSLDGGMMEYLDLRSSNKFNPNENYPRELLELFTIGKGPQIGFENYTTYTEDDIRAAARVLTGFRQNSDWWDTSLHDPDTGLPTGLLKPDSHDTDDKIFSDAFVSTDFPSPVTIVGGESEADMLRELDTLIHMIFEQEATALNICRKMYRFFVHYDITEEVETDIIVPLANILKSNDYNLGMTIEALLKSEHFYDEDGTIPEEHRVGAMIKTPVELVLGIIRFFKAQLPDPNGDLDDYYRRWMRDTVMNFMFNESGMLLFQPPTVAGYQAYHEEPDYARLWISSNTLPFRYTMAEMFTSGRKVTRGGDLYMHIDVIQMVTDKSIIPDFTGPDPLDGIVGTYTGGRFADHIVRCITDYAFPDPPAQERFDYFLNDLLLGNLSLINWRNEWMEFEATGDDSNIRPQLELFVQGILQSPEFQLA